MRQLYHKYKPHYQSNLKLAIPVVISQLGHTLVHTADSIIVGHFAGTGTRIVWLLLGLAPSILFVTGLLTWWRRVVGPARRRRLVRQARSDANVARME